MNLSALATVFVLGLRHGADPDHLAAIDNVVRNAHDKRPRLSRFGGLFFALGHSVMILLMSALAGFIAQHFLRLSAQIETAGVWVSITVLIAIAAYNIMQLILGRDNAGSKTRLLPPALRDASHPLIALPIGLLFGLGFETSSQIATYAVAMTADATLASSSLIGLTFCLGLALTDTLDGFMIHRLVTRNSPAATLVKRTWLWVVTAFAIIVALFELAKTSGLSLPLNELQLSALLTAGTLVVFIGLRVVMRRRELAAL